MSWTYLLALTLCADVAWKVEDRRDGLMLEVQAVSGSSYENIRVSGNSAASAEQLAQLWWQEALDASNDPAITRREVLEQSTDRVLVYDLVGMPLGSDRDHVMRMEQLPVAADAVQTLRFRSVDDPRRPPRDDRVRMRIDASLVVRPQQGGGCRFVYTVFTDIGGSFPAFFLRGAQRSGTLKHALELRERAEALKGKKRR